MAAEVIEWAHSPLTQSLKTTSFFLRKEKKSHHHRRVGLIQAPPGVTDWNHHYPHHTVGRYWIVKEIRKCDCFEKGRKKASSFQFCAAILTQSLSPSRVLLNIDRSVNCCCLRLPLPPLLQWRQLRDVILFINNHGSSLRTNVCTFSTPSIPPPYITHDGLKNQYFILFYKM